MAKAKTPGGRRTGGTTTETVQGGAIAADAPAKPRVNPGQFLSQVRAEGRKIVWPSRKETWITSVMVFIMVVLSMTLMIDEEVMKKMIMLMMVMVIIMVMMMGDDDDFDGHDVW